MIHELQSGMSGLSASSMSQVYARAVANTTTLPPPKNADKLPEIGSGGGGIEVWAGIGLSFRRTLHGGYFGLPKNLMEGGTINTNALVGAYAATLIFVVLLILYTMCLGPLTCCVFFKCIKKRRVNKGHQQFKNICSVLTIFMILAWSTVGFIGGLRGSAQLPVGLESWGNSMQYFFNDTSILVAQFPPSLKTAVANIKSSVAVAVDGIATNTKAPVVMKEIGGPGLPGPAPPAVDALRTAVRSMKGITTEGPNIDNLVSQLLTNVGQAQTAITDLTTSLATLNGATPYGGGSDTYTLSPAYSWDAFGANADLTTLNTPLTNAQSPTVQTVITNSLIGTNAPKYITTGHLAIDYWTNITDTVVKALLAKGNILKTTLNQKLDNFSNPLIKDAESAEKSLQVTLKDVKGTLKGLMDEGIFSGGINGFGNNVSKGIPILFICGLVLAAGIFGFAVFRQSTWLKTILPVIYVIALPTFIIGIIFFLFSFIFGDICAIFDGQSEGLRGLSPMAADLFVNFTRSRQSNCLAEDRGIVQFIIGAGALSQKDANLTLLATPTIQEFDLRPLATLQLAEIIPPNIDTLLVNGLTSPAADFLNAFSMSPYNAMGPIAFTTPLTTLQTMITGMADRQRDIQGTQGRAPNTPVSFVTYTGVVPPTYGQLNQLLTHLADAQAKANDVRDRLNAIRNSIIVLVDKANKVKTWADEIAPVSVHDTIANNIGPVKGALINYLPDENANLNAYLPTMKQNMIIGVEFTRTTFEKSLPCRDVMYDTVIFQDSICKSLLTASDALWTGLLAIALCLGIAIPCYGCIYHRIASRDRDQSLLDLIKSNKPPETEELPTGKVAPFEGDPTNPSVVASAPLDPAQATVAVATKAPGDTVILTSGDDEY
ncbi:hypothetical protein HDV05_004974 [Chytridiales sp. JEL 0842]|nr:hypothetical protein HDV05_004974 [Chytridiales sp. JEL 0842]